MASSPKMLGIHALVARLRSLLPGASRDRGRQCQPHARGDDRRRDRGKVRPPMRARGGRAADADLMVLRAGSRWLALPAQADARGGAQEHHHPHPHAPPHVLGWRCCAGACCPWCPWSAAAAGREMAPLPATLPRLVVIETDQARAAIVAEEVHGIVDFVRGQPARPGNAGPPTELGTG